MKVIAFYLPQFHTIPENNKWWGEGFTEWVNVKKAKPLFWGHQQPKVPYNDNYYNLLSDGVKAWQIEIAKANGIDGFCFYHYWFAGKLMLEKPIEQFIDNKKLQIPFCLCWANPDWTRVWAGEGSKVLIAQDYGDMNQWEAHLQYLLPFFKDSRYIKEEGKPLLVIYSPAEIRCIDMMLSYIRRRVKEEGFPDIKFAYQAYIAPEDERVIKPFFDYHIRFQPVNALHDIEDSGNSRRLLRVMRFLNQIVYRVTKIELSDYLLKIRKTEYDKVWKYILDFIPEDDKDIACAFVNWDNTPRRGRSGRVITGATPKKFEQYLIEYRKVIEKYYATDYLFITAWNEWSEGSYLEPDKLDGYGYLNALKNALSDYK